jgi:hypothetical protein
MPQKEDLVAVDTLPTQGMASQGNVGKPKSRVFDISEDLTEPTDLYE